MTEPDPETSAGERPEASTAAGLRTRRVLAVSVLLLAAITAIRVVLIGSLADQGYFLKYLSFADRILSGTVAKDRLTDLSPGYLWLVVLLRAAGAEFTTIRALQIVLVSVAAGLCGVAARRFGVIASIAAAVFVLASRAALVCATEMEPETLILLLNAGALAMLMQTDRMRPGDEARRVAVGGTLLGLSAICRPVALAIAAVVAIVQRSWRCALFAAIPMLAILGVNFALTGEATVMDPGTVFYEGMNPNASGYEGVQPRIVNDLERTTREPDYLHVAYRIVASRSTGRPLSRGESNRFWSAKAMAFARTYPATALRLTGRKLLFALQSHDAWDLSTMAKKDALLGRFPFLPFGLLVALAGSGVWFRRREVLLPLVFALGAAIPMVAFYVTARQRNAVLPAVAVLAAIGLADLVRRRAAMVAVIVVLAAVVLSIDGPAQIEDDNGWSGARNDFDRAISLEQKGNWRGADQLLLGLESEGYRPLRENRAVSSVAYYRAVAALKLGRDPRPLLARADQEAAGNDHVLALQAALGDEESRRRLLLLHDRLTADRAWQEARAMTGMPLRPR